MSRASGLKPNFNLIKSTLYMLLLEMRLKIQNELFDTLKKLLLLDCYLTCSTIGASWFFIFTSVSEISWSDITWYEIQF